MSIYISKQLSGVGPSLIREIFKYAADPGVISMSAGNPDPNSLPISAISEIMREIAANDLNLALGYSVSEGYPPLRELLKTHLAAQECFRAGQDDLIVTSGSQQGIDFVCRALTDPGDRIIVEAPSFTGSLNCFRSHGLEMRELPIEPDGICPDKLEAALKQDSRVRFIYLIPNFQNPTGYTMSRVKRAAVYEIANRYGIPILEDDPYGDLRFEGEDIPAIKTLDKSGLVIYLRSFSKVLAAGIRVGYFSFPAELLGPLTVAKQANDVHTGMLSQLVCHRFLSEYEMSAHLDKIASVYRQKYACMAEALSALPGEKLSFSPVQGGLFVWCRLEDGSDAAALALRLVQEKKVAVVPGVAFYSSGRVSPHIRLTFATPTPEQIKKGVAAIGEIL